MPVPTVISFESYTPPAGSPNAINDYVQADGEAGITWDHEVTGTNPGLIVVSANVSVHRLRRATYAGITMLPWHAIDVNGTTTMGWYLANPPAGVNSIVVTYQPIVGQFESTFVSVLLNGVDPTSQYNTPIVSSGTGDSPSITITNGTDELSVAFCFAPAAITPDVGDVTIGSVVGNRYGHSRLTAVCNDTGIHEFSLPSSNNWAVIGLSFKPVGATGNPPLPAEESFKANQTYSATVMCGTIATHHADWVLNGYTGSGAIAIFAEASASGFYYCTQYGMYRFAEYLPSLAAMLIQGAQRSGDVYNDYMISTPDTRGYKFFLNGLVCDYGVRALPITLEYLEHYRDGMAYSSDVESLEFQIENTASLSRELSRHVQAHIACAAVGITPARPVRYAQCVDWMYDHIREYFVDESWIGQNWHFASFQMGILMRSIIEDHDGYGLYAGSEDVRAVPQVRIACDYLMEHFWHDPSQSFLYQLNPDNPEGPSLEGAPELNNLIGPAFAWVAVQLKPTDPSAAAEYMALADKSFAGSAFNAQYQLGKQYNQQMQWVFEQLDWRNEYYELAAGPPRRLTPGRLRRGRRRNG